MLMTASRPLDVGLEWLVRHHTWANKTVVESCKSLTEEELARNFEMGWGTIELTLLHMVGAIMRWCDRLGDRPLRPFPEESQRKFTIDEISSMMSAACNDFETCALRPSSGTGGTVSVVLSTTGRRDIPGVVVCGHIITHSAHHRAQIANMLRRNGRKVPEVDVIDFWESTAATAGRAHGTGSEV
jgi:uncharacterized damage-inducible protein DinB